MASPNHRQEWEASAIAPSLIDANLISIDGQDALDRLFIGNVERLNTGRVANKHLRTYQHIERGGWFCRALDPLNNWEEQDWSQCKPDFPRTDGEGKIVKYEPPPKCPSRLYFLMVPDDIWGKISRRYGISREGYSQFWEWVLDHPEIPIFIPEGAKKAGALLSAGYVAVALPGVSMGWRGGPTHGTKRRLLPELKLFAKGREFIIAYDSDKKESTRQKVKSAGITLGRLLLAQKAAAVHPMSWCHERGKGIDDVLFAEGEGAIADILASSPDWEEWVGAPDYRTLDRTPDLVVNQRYLDFEIPRDRPLVVIKSCQGTGKTELLGRYIGEAQKTGQPSLTASNRETLARALGERFGVPYRTERDTIGRSLGFSLCVDSMRPKFNGFNVENWYDAHPIFVLDEAEQVLKHLLSGETDVKDHRPAILHQFQETVILAAATGQIIISDADISPLSIELLEKIVGFDLNPYIVVNEYQPEAWRITNYEQPNPIQWHRDLFAAIARGEKTFIYTSSQQAKSILGTIGLERRIREKYPDKKVIRIDAETLANKEHPAYGQIAKLDELIADYDIIIVSPSIQTGVSIDIQNHFDSVWGYSAGNVPPHDFLQALWRVRDCVPRYVWCPKMGLGRVANGLTDDRQILASNDLLIKTHLALLNQVELSDTRIDARLDRSFTVAWSKFAARHNAESYSYRKTFLEAVANQGHNILAPVEAISKKEIKEIRAEIQQDTQIAWQERCTAIASAPRITDTEASRISEAKTRTEQETLSLSRHIIEKRCGGMDATTELVDLVGQGKLSKWQLLYKLTEGAEFVEHLDMGVIDRALMRGEGTAFTPDLNRQLSKAKVWLLEQVRVVDILKKPEISLSDPDVVDFAKRVYEVRQDFLTAFGIAIRDPEQNGENHSVPVVKQVVGLLGRDLVSGGRKQVAKIRRHIYKWKDEHEELRREIFERWRERDGLSVARQRIDMEQIQGGDGQSLKLGTRVEIKSPVGNAVTTSSFSDDRKDQSPPRSLGLVRDVGRVVALVGAGFCWVESQISGARRRWRQSELRAMEVAIA